MDDIRHQTTLQMASLIDIDDEDGIDIIQLDNLTKKSS